MEAQWSLVLFTVISGAGAWLFAAAIAQAFAKKGALPGKVTCVVSAVLLALGGVASMTHLKHIDRIFEALNHPTSGIFVEAAMIGVLIVLLVIYFILVVRKSSESALKVVGAVTAVVGIVFTFACGMSYMMDARPAWMTYALPLAYCLTAGSAGVGLNALLQAVGVDAGRKAAAEGDLSRAPHTASSIAVSFAGLLEFVVSVVAIVCCIAFMVHAANWLADAVEGAVVWIGVTFVAGVIACVSGVWAWKKPESGKVAGVVALIAGVVFAVALRVAMWMVGSPVMDFFLMPLD